MCDSLTGVSCLRQAQRVLLESVMSPNRRIFLNIVATYGRSLYALVCGLLISRWVLAAVGKSECGLNCGGGGMTVMALLAFTMRQVRISSEVVDRAARFTYDEVVRLPERKARTPKGPQRVERSIDGCGLSQLGVCPCGQEPTWMHTVCRSRRLFR